MASKTAFMAVVLLVLVAGHLAHGHAVPPLRRGTRSLGWTQGMKGGPPSGMQPSDTAAAAARRRAISSMQKGRALCIIALIIFWWYSKNGHRKRSRQRRANRTAASLAWRKASSSRLCRDSSSRPFLRTLPEKRSHHRASMHTCHGIDHH